MGYGGNVLRSTGPDEDILAEFPLELTLSVAVSAGEGHVGMEFDEGQSAAGAKTVELIDEFNFISLDVTGSPGNSLTGLAGSGHHVGVVQNAIAQQRNIGEEFSSNVGAAVCDAHYGHLNGCVGGVDDLVVVGGYHDSEGTWREHGVANPFFMPWPKRCKKAIASE